MDKAAIEKEAKRIMDNFLEALRKETFSCDIGSERKKNVRQDGKREEDPYFHEHMLKNAPKTNNGYIQAEKKKW